MHGYRVAVPAAYIEGRVGRRAGASRRPPRPALAQGAAGDLDPSFSRNGKVRTDFRHRDVANSMAIDFRRRIVAAGRGGHDFALARYIG
jgi:hypothetical protein